MSHTGVLNFKFTTARRQYKMAAVNTASFLLKQWYRATVRACVCGGGWGWGGRGCTAVRVRELVCVCVCGERERGCVSVCV